MTHIMTMTVLLHCIECNDSLLERTESMVYKMQGRNCLFIFFFKIILKKEFQKYNQGVKQLGPRSGLKLFSPDLCLNCL